MGRKYRKTKFQVSSTVDDKLKESEEFLDEKREDAAKTASLLSESLNPSAVLEKAKGFLNCEYFQWTSFFNKFGRVVGIFVLK